MPFTYHSSIHHDGSSRYVISPRPGELHYGDEVTIRLRMAPESPVERVLLRTCPDGEQHFTAMQPAEREPACQWWQATLPVNMPASGYRFLIFAQDGAWHYNAGGLHRSLPTDAEDFRLLANYAAPTWVYDSVFYQIFPDRFANGDPSNDVQTGEFSYRGYSSQHRPWGIPPAKGIAAMTEFFGGDLQGIRDHLDYLQELGVSALYLNPIFTSTSNHRYDVIDYFHVDPHLGGDQALVELRAELDRRGMSLILDIVPNHCGVLHPWFQEAQANPQTSSSEYFTFLRHPNEYACWLGVKSLPKLNYRSAALREIMYAGNKSIFRHWLRPPYSIDGWRLDVANMLGRQGPDQLGLEVGRGIRQAVKEENSQAYLMGENFFDASGQLQGDCWDAVMNYWGFAKPLHYWLSGFQVHQHAQPNTIASSVPWTAQDLAESWQNVRAAIPWQIARQQFNLLGSHDTPRILTQLNGDRSMACLAAAVLMTYVGVSSIYYGDEIGQGATPGTTSRDSMPWDRQEWDLEMLDFYQRLIHLRRTSPALIDGGFQVLLAEGDTLAYLRDHPQELLIVVAQRHSSTRPTGGLPVAHGAIPDGVEFTELFSGQRATVSNGHLPLPSLSPGVQIWVSKD